MQKGRDNCINAYSTFLEGQLMKIRDRMSPDDFANNLVSDIAFGKISNGYMLYLYLWECVKIDLVP